jgi:hypothetical protein
MLLNFRLRAPPFRFAHQAFVFCCREAIHARRTYDTSSLVWIGRPFGPEQQRYWQANKQQRDGHTNRHHGKNRRVGGSEQPHREYYQFDRDQADQTALHSRAHPCPRGRLSWQPLFISIAIFCHQSVSDAHTLNGSHAKRPQRRWRCRIGAAGGVTVAGADDLAAPLSVVVRDSGSWAANLSGKRP